MYILFVLEAEGLPWFGPEETWTSIYFEFETLPQYLSNIITLFHAALLRSPFYFGGCYIQVTSTLLSDVHPTRTKTPPISHSHKHRQVNPLTKTGTEALRCQTRKQSDQSRFLKTHVIILIYSVSGNMNELPCEAGERKHTHSHAPDSSSRWEVATAGISVS